MATQTLTMTEAAPASSAIEMQPASASRGLSPGGKTLTMAPGGDNISDTPLGIDGGGTVPPPAGAVEVLPRWNSPRVNMHRTFATFLSFLVVGMNDGSYGALVPLLEFYYDLSYTAVSCVFLSPFAGYAIASAVNNLMHVHFGQRGVAVAAPVCHLVPYIVFAFHPPFPVLVVLFIFVGMGNGLADAAWCAYAGQMANAHELSGILQAFYAFGATISPLIVTALATEGRPGWFAFYYVMAAAAALELVTSAYTFWAQTGAIYLAENPSETGKAGRTRQSLKSKLTWIFALFIFGYCGAEIALGGWIVVFMTRVRGATALAGGAAATGYWGGMTFGRLVLPFVTVRLGEFWSMIMYLCLTIALELVFWLVPNLVVSAVAAALIGVCMAPMFPTAVVLITKLLPRHLHVGTIGFATAFGGSGGAILPFAVGAIAQAKGVQTLQPIILAICAALALLWMTLPRSSKASTA